MLVLDKGTNTNISSVYISIVSVVFSSDRAAV